ncbi:hypothetical protein GUJ93_ZPchr0014g46756 [Zizania palustris]|uniref:Uncharacterized protein n=1 Tax=Zizania palustris TaxID=103762 RepID=A0A8J5TL84_ZIZPA|nr:hypothetical protein GUJ93_ZPchr0014g46756 [Zizania palustris]
MSRAYKGSSQDQEGALGARAAGGQTERGARPTTDEWSWREWRGMTGWAWGWSFGGSPGSLPSAAPVAGRRSPGAPEQLSAVLATGVVAPL